MSGIGSQLATIIVCILAERECKDALHPENAVNHMKGILRDPE